MELASSLAITGWFVQVVFDKIFIAILQLTGVVAYNPGLPGALDNLSDAMNKVLTLLKIIQSFPRETEALLPLLDGLVDATYDAEDLLSEHDYYRIQHQVKDQKTNSSNIGHSMVGAAGRYLSRLQLTINEDYKASTSSTTPSFRNIVDRIHENVARLNKIVDNVYKVINVLKPTEGLNTDSNVFLEDNNRVTTSLLRFNKTVYGRDSETDQIVELLLSPIPECVRMIPIVGTGGVGKTTLARTIYNHERVEKHFDRRIWICVSYNFDVARIIREMLQGLDADRFTDLERLQELLKKEKILLVLDDVSNDLTKKKWNVFCAALGSGKTGSRVLLTTRLEPVARIISKGDLINLNGLHDNHYLSLFYMCAFGCEDPHSHPEFEDAELIETGRQIACKLKGSPLAAKTVGGFLRKNLHIRYWRSILELLQNEVDIITVLKLSYQHLPAHLRGCFTFCSMFPKGWHFEKDELVAMWISHDYIVVDNTTRGSKTLEDIGNQYFDDLVSRSFFQTGEHPKEMYVLLDLMHDLAISVSKARGRHLFANSSDLIHLKGSNLKNLRTLVVHRDGDIVDDSKSIFEEVLKGLNSIRVLVFHPSLQSLPGNVCQLIHLRYLKLVISPHITQIQGPIPDSWCKLFHLQWMIFLENYRSLSLPINMNDLVKLRRFFGDGGKFGMIVGIGKLTCLQELESFSIGNIEGRKLGELKMLRDLGGSLEIRYLENVTTKDQALEAELNKKRRIQELQLHCGVSHASPEVAEQVFEGLSPPADIKRLVIDGYGGVKSPKWMVPGNMCVSYLESLRLSRCLKWKDLPSLGQLLFLRNLEICEANAVVEIGMGFYGTGDAPGFPSLETLVIECMPQLAIWSGVKDYPRTIFPKLHTLTISGCPELELKELENLGILKILKISGCNKLQSMPPLPASLVELWISHCPVLLALFNTELEDTVSNLTSLEMISIQDCPQFAKLKSPPSLKELITKRCKSDMSVTDLPVTIEKWDN